MYKFGVVIWIVYSISAGAYAGTSGDWESLVTPGPNGVPIGMKIFKNDVSEKAKVEAKVEMDTNNFIWKRYEQLQAKYGDTFPDSWKVNPFVKYYRESELAGNKEFAAKKLQIGNKPVIVMENLTPRPADSYSFKSLALQNHLQAIQAFIEKKFKNPAQNSAMVSAFFKKLYQICLLSFVIGVTIDDSDFFITLPEGEFTDPADYVNKISIKIADLGESVNILKSDLGDNTINSLRDVSCVSTKIQTMMRQYPISLEEAMDIIKDMDDIGEGEVFYKNKMDSLISLMKTIMTQFSPDSATTTADLYKSIVFKEMSNFIPLVEPEIKKIASAFEAANPAGQRLEHPNRKLAVNPNNRIKSPTRNKVASLEAHPVYKDCRKQMLELKIRDNWTIQTHCQIAVDDYLAQSPNNRGGAEVGAKENLTPPKATDSKDYLRICRDHHREAGMSKGNANTFCLRAMNPFSTQNVLGQGPNSGKHKR